MNAVETIIMFVLIAVVLAVSGWDVWLAAQRRWRGFETTTATPWARFAQRVGSWETVLRQCALNEDGRYGPSCPETITLRESEAAGHRGYCSVAHHVETRENSPT